ncbi:shikimate dehydrogenase [Rhizobium deserti]|uniref:Shikimate dehydrogenase n=1 Tax=Rhizobium deserti TaxID=2547961 RepID=A0A4R5U5Q7_9HYPH|nr:shikimate dehydrogenase [Rhizobium deserti]TDK29304.1 shikimate dehydrogenase [Rhizobium deserti]
MINGNSKIIAHIGYPTHTFKAPLIYNPYFEESGIDAAVVPMGCRAEDYPAFLRLIFKLSNIHGALITMPHKIVTVGMLDNVSKKASVAGACNAVRLGGDGRLVGDMFDGEGFVRGVRRRGRAIEGKRAIIAGAGGVGSAIAASLAQAGIAELALNDAYPPMMNDLAERLRTHYPKLQVVTGETDPEGYDIVVNATPLGMHDDDLLPFDVQRIRSSAFVGEVVLKQDITPFLAAVRARGCEFQIGVDMLFEQIPAYLEFFGFPTTTPDHLRSIARV